MTDNITSDSNAIEAIREQLPEYARDLRLNLSSVLTIQGAPGLNDRQIAATALATAIASRNAQLTRGIESWAATQLDAAYLNAARAASAIMGMNNVYYRFLHLVEAPDYQNLPARLRMNIIGNPGIDRLDFELLSLAVSAVNACGMCVTAHERKLREGGVTVEAIQSAVRIASVVHAVAVALEYQAAA
jgi:lipoyl-dependent peroxiredoxin subunit D